MSNKLEKAFALLLSSILRTSKFLGLILFGVKR